MGGNYHSGTWGYNHVLDSAPVRDEGLGLHVKRDPVPEWDRDHGGNGPLWAEGQDLIRQGYTPDEAAKELRLRYGRQAQATGEELTTAITARGGDAMAQTDWATEGKYGDENEDRALWEIAAEIHAQTQSWAETTKILNERYGLGISESCVSDRVPHYVRRAETGGGTTENTNWMEPGVYHEQCLAQIAAELKAEDYERTWADIADNLVARFEIGLPSPQTVSAAARRWRERVEDGDGDGLEARPTNGDGDDRGLGARATETHPEGCECDDCQNMRAHFEQWEQELEEDEDPFGDDVFSDGGEGEPGPSIEVELTDEQWAEVHAAYDDAMRRNGNGDGLEARPTNGEEDGERGLMIDFTDAISAEEALAMDAFDVVTITMPAEMARALMLPDDNGDRLEACPTNDNGDGEACSLEMHVPGVDLSISADGPVEWAERMMLVRSALDMLREAAAPPIADDDLAKLEEAALAIAAEKQDENALEDYLAERRAG